jgi:hypothetical protein
MLALLEGDLPHPDMADTFDCELVEVGERACGLPGDAAAQALQPAGIGAGGLVRDPARLGLGCAVQTKLPAGRGYKGPARSI